MPKQSGHTDWIENMTIDIGHDTIMIVVADKGKVTLEQAQKVRKQGST